jgi:hypothetical protein
MDYNVSINYNIIYYTGHNIRYWLYLNKECNYFAIQILSLFLKY